MILKNLAEFIFVFFFLSMLIFSISYLSRGSAVYANFPQNVSEEDKTRIEASIGLNKSFLWQYTHSMKELLSLKARSLISGEKLVDILPLKALYTFLLALIIFFLLIFFSVFLAVFCLYARNIFVDFFVNLLSFTFLSLPIFVTALLLIMVFNIYLDFVPIFSSGKDLFDLLFLPVLVLVLAHLANFFRFSKSIIKDSLKQDFIAAAFARGLSRERIYFHFALKYSLPAIITYFGVNFISIFMGAFVVESIFGYPGIGELGVKSIINKDYPMVLSVALLSIFFVFAFKLISRFLSFLISARW